MYCCTSFDSPKTRPRICVAERPRRRNGINVLFQRSNCYHYCSQPTIRLLCLLAQTLTGPHMEYRHCGRILCILYAFSTCIDHTEKHWVFMQIQLSHDPKYSMESDKLYDTYLKSLEKPRKVVLLDINLRQVAVSSGDDNSENALTLLKFLYS